MVDDPEERAEDDEVSGWLRRWEAPASSAGLDARVLASYRAAAGGSRWRRLWSARVSLPLPVAALLAAGMLTAAGFALHGLHAGHATEAGGEKATTISTGLADLRPLPEVRLRVVRRGEPERGSGQ